METTKMKIEYRKQIDSETAPWQLLTNIDELLWNGVYNLRITADDGSSNLPFRLGNDDTVTLVIKDHSHEGMLQGGRTIVQTITRVERSTGNVLSYTRTRCSVAGVPTWNYWTLATPDGATIDIPKATPSSLGGVIVGQGLAVDADGKVTIAGNSIGSEALTHSLNVKIDTAAAKANLADLFVFNEGLTLHTGALMENSAPYAGTTYTAYTDRILANGEFLVANSGYTITACKVFNGEQETEFHANLAFDSYHLAGDATTYYQLQFVKNDATAFTVDELSQVVRLYRRKPIVWNANSHIDRFITPGTYNISGQRTNVADGLPIANAASGHTLHARLVVLDSSITGSGKASDKCITQILTLSNRVGGDGNIYVRTGRAASEGQLACGNGWGTWGKLQQNIEVGQTASLDGYVDNGIYSGVYTNGTTFFETFVMLILNNYAVAAATGAARSITQVKYAVDIDGTFSYKVRTGQGTDVVEWGEWSDLDTVTTDRIQDGAVTAQKLSNDVREKVYNPMRQLFIAAGAEYNDTDIVQVKKVKFDLDWNETVEHLPHCYCLNGLGDISEDEMLKIYNVGCFYGGVYGALSGLLNRTNLGRLISANFSLDTPNLAYMCQCTTISLCVPTISYESTFAIKSNNYFYGATKLRAIYGRLSMDNNYSSTFKNCASLERVKIRTSASVSLADSPLMSKKSLLYMINEANPTSAITITLHSDAYARLADDADIVAALEAQPLVSLVSA